MPCLSSTSARTPSKRTTSRLAWTSSTASRAVRCARDLERLLEPVEEALLPVGLAPERVDDDAVVERLQPLAPAEAPRQLDLGELVRDLAIGLGDRRRVAVCADASFVDPDRALAHLADRAQVVRDDDDRGASCAQLAHAHAALEREPDVADRQRLVDEQDVGDRRS